MSELLSYTFVQNALLAALLSGISCGIIGTYIVTRRLVFLSGGITHSSFGGIGIAYWAGLDPTLGALVFGVLSAFGIEALGRGDRLRPDTAIGILWSFGMAIGILFIFLTPGYAPNLMGFLFGNLLLTSWSYIKILIALVAFLIVIFTILYRIIISVSVDNEYSTSQGVWASTINYFMIALTAITIVLNIQIVGIVLLISMLTIPVAIVNTLTNSFSRIMIFSSIVAAFAAIGGLAASYLWDVPSSAMTVAILALIFGLVKGMHLVFIRYREHKSLA
ncbi:MAG: metal ABC transporter permease [Mucinivorans sp.]